MIDMTDPETLHATFDCLEETSPRLLPFEIPSASTMMWLVPERADRFEQIRWRAGSPTGDFPMLVFSSGAPEEGLAAGPRAGGGGRDGYQPESFV
jgi:hypothetical protein